MSYYYDFEEIEELFLDLRNVDTIIEYLVRELVKVKQRLSMPEGR